MNIRLKRYKQYRLEGLNQYQSAIKAGYKESYARDKAYLLDKSVEVGIKDAIELGQGFTTTVQAKLLTTIATDTSERTNDRLSAIKMISALTGREENVIEVKHTGNTQFFQSMVDKAGVIEGYEERPSTTYQLTEPLNDDNVKNTIESCD